jgi:excisionase family DNA binding protein
MLSMSDSVTLLTQAEAAKLLRCSVGKVARERRLRRLAYIPGRPVLLRLEDVLDWLERRRVTAKTKDAKPYNPTIAARRAALRHHTKTKG